MTVRFLHTADWHVGKLIRGRSRVDEHRAVLGEIAEIAASERVDAVLVAGDLFETAAPTPESEAVVYDALLALAATGAHVVAVAGNHDNGQRLAAVAPFAALGRVHLAGAVTRPHDGGVVHLDARDGTRAEIALLPFVSQRGILKADELMDLDADQRSPAYADRVRRILGHLCAGFGPDTVNVVLAHAFVAGGTLGGGERTAHTIFDYSVPATAFPVAAQYVALGHLHRAQDMAGACPTRYPGSPLRLDFGEDDAACSVTIVDVAPGLPAEVRSVELREGRRLRTVAGTLEELRAQAAADDDAWLRVIVHEATRAGLADEVRVLFPHAVDVRVVAPEVADSVVTRPDRSGRTPTELFAEFCASERVDDPRVAALFADLLDAAAGGEP